MCVSGANLHFFFDICKKLKTFFHFFLKNRFFLVILQPNCISYEKESLFCALSASDDELRYRYRSFVNVRDGRYL